VGNKREREGAVLQQSGAGRGAASHELVVAVCLLPNIRWWFVVSEQGGWAGRGLRAGNVGKE
jgi:hypothetical protein